MKTINEEVAKLSWRDLLGIVCLSFNEVYSQYRRVEGEAIDDFKARFSGPDIERNLPDIYKVLFGDKNQEHINCEVDKLLNQLKADVNNPQDSVFNDIEILQQVVSTAMWKYNIKVLPILEKFVREFDRIDDERERVRIINGYHKGYSQ